MDFKDPVILQGLAIDMVLNEVRRERERQEQLVKAGKFLWTCASNVAPIPMRYPSPVNFVDREITNAEKLAVLAEEFGEVSKEVVEEIIHNDRGDADNAKIDRSRLRRELVQVAAVCVAWCEALDKREP